MNKQQQAKALLSLRESTEGKIIYISRILGSALHKFAERAIEDCNKTVLSILLLDDEDNSKLKAELEKTAKGEKSDLYDEYFDKAIDKVIAAAEQMNKLADFIEAAPDDDTPVSEQEKKAIKKEKNFLNKFHINEHLEEWNAIKRELCSYRKSNAIEIYDVDYIYRSSFHLATLCEHYYGNSLEYTETKDYDSLIQNLRKTSEAIKQMLEA